MSNVKTNTATGKPRITGGIYRAPKGTDLPTDATSALDEAFKCLGYISDDGVSNEKENDEEIKAWGGDTVISTVNDNFKFTLIECLNVEVLKTVYGDGNVTGTLENGITIKSNDDPQEEHVFVIETMLRDAMKRIVIPRGQVTAVGEVTYSDGDAVGYETTVGALVDDNNNNHYEYIAKKA